MNCVEIAVAIACSALGWVMWLLESHCRRCDRIRYEKHVSVMRSQIDAWRRRVIELQDDQWGDDGCSRDVVEQQQREIDESELWKTDPDAWRERNKGNF